MQHKHVTGGEFSPDGQRVLSWNDNGMGQLWDAMEGKPVGNWLKHDRAVRGATYSRDGQRVLTWSDDNTARLWRAADGTAIGQPMQHHSRVVGSISGATFSHDEEWILTSSKDGTARIWHAMDGTPIGRPLKQDKGILGAAFSKDERGILTWDEAGTARLWHVEADYDFPVEHIPLLLEVLTGTTMDDFGNIRALDGTVWNHKRKYYIQVAEDHLRKCQFVTANLFETQKKLWGIEHKESGPGHSIRH